MGPRKKAAAKKGKKAAVPAEPEQEAPVEDEHKDSLLETPAEAPATSVTEIDGGATGEAEPLRAEIAPAAAEEEISPSDAGQTHTPPPPPPTAKPAPAVPFSTAEMNSRLFQLRMKINQGRKANEAEAEEEFKRLNKGRRKGVKDEDEDDDGKKQSKQSADPVAVLLNQTAQEAEWEAAKARKKGEIAATYGLNAFTTDASYRAYEKRVEKLHRQQVSSSSAAPGGGAASLVENPLDYGKVGAKVSAAGLERLQQDVLDREDRRRQFSKRRLTTDADVDYINDKNAAFNKKLKNAYNKYTIEIRQNLERGTAV